MIDKIFYVSGNAKSSINNKGIFMFKYYLLLLLLIDYKIFSYINQLFAKKYIIMYIFNKTIQNCPIKIFNFVTFQRDEEFVELYELIETTGFAYFHIVCRKFDMNPSLEQESMFIILLLISIKFLFFVKKSLKKYFISVLLNLIAPKHVKSKKSFLI